MKEHGIFLHKGEHMPSSLYRKLADTVSRRLHTPRVDGTVFCNSANHISDSFRRPPHSGPLKASKVGSSASSFHISKVSVLGKDIWGNSRRRHGSCVILLDDRNLSDVRSQIGREVGKFRKATAAEVQSFGSCKKPPEK